MKRTQLLASVALALTLGLVPALAQQDRSDSKLKRDQDTIEQHKRASEKQQQKAKENARKDETVRDSSNQSANGNANGAKAAESGTDKAGAKEKSADSDKSSAQSKQAQDQNKDQGQKPTGAAASDKAKAEPSKNAERNNAGSPDAQKSTQSSQPGRNAPGNAKANDTTNDTNRNARTSEPNRNASSTNNGGQANTRISASLDPQKKTQLTTAFEKVNVRPVTNVNFSVSVGTVIPRDIEIRPVPPAIVEIVPQYRGYDFLVVRDEVVIVEPHTHKIVDVIERGPSRSRAESTTIHKPQLSSQQREIIRRHAQSRAATTTGRGSRTTTEITVGERLPDTIELESFPDEVYREVPSVREYRYIDRGDEVYLVDPSSREVIEEVR